MPASDGTNILDLVQRPEDAISSTLAKNIAGSTGHYSIQNVWQIDATSNLPVGTTMNISLS